MCVCVCVCVVQPLWLKTLFVVSESLSECAAKLLFKDRAHTQVLFNRGDPNIYDEVVCTKDCIFACEYPRITRP